MNAKAVSRSSEDRSAKARLARKLNDIIQSRALRQNDVALLLAMPQPKVSAIRNYKLKGISLQRLLQALASLGQHVEIVVRPSTSTTRAGIDVAA